MYVRRIWRCLGHASGLSGRCGSLAGAARLQKVTVSTAREPRKHGGRLKGGRVQPACIFALGLLVLVLWNSGCWKCATDAECDDGRFCNGTEFCGVDVFGVGPYCRDGLDPCTNPTPVCDEDQDTCHACTDDQGCNDGVACTDDFCDEASGECSHIENDSKCRAGHLCDAQAGCYRGECRSDEDCAPPTPRCGNTERGPSCVECMTDADCPTGQVCQYARECR
jgi:Cys-rich repeat protein